MQLIPILQTADENEAFKGNPLCASSLYVTIDYYKTIGFNPPWIGYYVEKDGVLVGAAAFKGAPVNNKVEIAYGTFEPFQQQGIGTTICRLLVERALQANPNVKITARTLPENNFSTKLLQKNNFKYAGIVNDPDDGDVWEWVYAGD